MHRFLLNFSRTVTRSKKCGNVFKNIFCELSTVKTVSTGLLNNKICNYLSHNKFCTRTKDDSKEYVKEEDGGIEDAAEEYISEEDIKLISEGDSELERKLRVIILEADVMRQDGKCVPSLKFMKYQHWQELLTLKTRTARSKFLAYLFKTQKTIENRVAKKEQRRLVRESEPKIKFPDDGIIRYHLGANNMFLRIYDITINHMYNNKLIQAMQFGQKLIIDCGFHNHMNRKENTNCAKQLMLMFSENRYHDDPFDLHFCNLQKDNNLHEGLLKFIPPMYNPDFPLNLYESSYLDIFPKDKLVYLTPHCREVLNEFDHDALYIVGAIVDKTNNEPLTLAKAKQEGIRMAKLPLDSHLLWGSGSNKSLTLNQIVAILLDIKHTGDWAHSLRHVPKRKLHASDNMQSIRTSEQLGQLSDDLPISRQLFQAARRSNREGFADVNNKRMKPVMYSNWRPNRSYDHDSAKKDRKLEIKSLLEPYDR